MSNNLTLARGGGGNTEEQQIQTINSNNRRGNNNNIFSSLEINHIILSYHTVISQFNLLTNL